MKGKRRDGRGEVDDEERGEGHCGDALGEVEEADRRLEDGESLAVVHRGGNRFVQKRGGGKEEESKERERARSDWPPNARRSGQGPPRSRSSPSLLKTALGFMYFVCNCESSRVDLKAQRMTKM